MEYELETMFEKIEFDAATKVMYNDICDSFKDNDLKKLLKKNLDALIEIAYIKGQKVELAKQVEKLEKDRKRRR